MFHVCLNVCVVYGIGACVNGCGVVCCLFLMSGCCLLCFDVVGEWGVVIFISFVMHVV